MHRNYLLIAWRILLKYKTFSVVNVAGLASGMAACLLILEFVHYERSYDQFHLQQERIYRVELDSYQNGKLEYKSAVNYPAAGPAMQAEFSEVEAFVRLNTTTGLLSRQAEKDVSVLLEPNQVYYTEESFFSVFSFPLLSGTRTALRDPNTLLLSSSLSRTLFGNENPIGKTLHFKRGAHPESAGSFSRADYFFAQQYPVAASGHGAGLAFGLLCYQAVVRKLSLPDGDTPRPVFAAGCTGSGHFPGSRKQTDLESSKG